MLSKLKGNGKKEQQLMDAWIPPYFERIQVIEALVRIRQDWEEAVESESLIDAQTSVGLLLGDIALQLDLTSEEQAYALGEQLRRDFFAAICRM